MQVALSQSVRVRLFISGSVYEYDATVTEICGTEIRVSINATGESVKVQKGRCEIVTEGRK